VTQPYTKDPGTRQSLDGSADSGWRRALPDGEHPPDLDILRLVKGTPEIIVISKNGDDDDASHAVMP
jgi:hypothetical protein